VIACPACAETSKAAANACRFTTSLARAGVSLAMAQRLLRHSTPILTASIYTRLELHDARGAVAKLDAPPTSEPAPRSWG
jgi:hypothetical protein